MAWRFKASKYKNAAPIVPKLETCIRDICVGSYQTYGNNIAASAAFMAFNWEHAGKFIYSSFAVKFKEYLFLSLLRKPIAIPLSKTRSTGSRITSLN